LSTSCSYCSSFSCLLSAAIVKASFKVELPKAASAGEAVESTLNIVLTKDDVLYVNGDKTTVEALGRICARRG